MERTGTQSDMIRPAPTKDAGAGRKATRSDFIAVQSAASLLRNSLALYRANFRPLFMAYVLPTFPFLIAQQVGQLTKNDGLALGAGLISIMVSIATIGATTLTVADVCLGNTPSVRRSYARLFHDGLWRRLLLTSGWQIIATLLGFMLLVVPGIILSVRLFFTSSVVVLERLSGNAALKRSLHLSKGHFWRLWGDMIVLAAVFVAAPLCVLAIAAGAAGAVSAALGAGTGSLWLLIPIMVISALELVVYPLLFIGMVLLYYDLRVRKEAYDVAALSEDMMR